MCDVRYVRSGLPVQRSSRAALYGTMGHGVLFGGLIWLVAGDLRFGLIMAGGLIAFALIALLLRGRLTVDADRLVIAVPPVFRKVIALSEIVDVRLGEINSVAEVGGTGYRRVYGTGGAKRAFVHEAGPSVEVATQSGKTYVISDPNAERLSAVLRAGAGLD
ncbi:hypothetical protein EV191_109167 [Tamaricihabitans halophyticus]|uniref:PH (Pleckstrin Homology) domain-containing protein n=1 Tax=Tamaricihabitans halophyticus TaxID=1262583 RepID=A0A4R2QQP0_9PSEU|nr:hypothetical protein [Tamaricihabitans halophyticus]TCP49345.1 hypothetical protein EV191_109167 [Tamaricihabitans halophyticus]